MRNLNWWIKFVSIVILVACRSSNHSFKQSIIIFVMHKKIDIKQDNIEKKKAFDVIFGSTHNLFKIKYVTFFLKKRKELCVYFFFFVLILLLILFWVNARILKTKKKRNWIFFVAEGGSEISCYERVDSFGNFISAICQSWQIEVEAELLEYA